MRVHITNLNGFNYDSAVSLAQANSLKIGQSMGFSEMGIFSFDYTTDSENELSKRLDGIIASIWHGDIIILQLPTWCETPFEEKLINKLKDYAECKLIIFVHDVIPFMINGAEANITHLIEVYNRADVIILPSKRMHEKLVEHGLSVEKVIYQTIWDFPMQQVFENHHFNKRLYFTGNEDRFPFLREWECETEIYLYDGKEYSGNSNSVNYRGFKSNIELLSEVSQGGFGLIWADENQYEYYKLNQPYKMATFMAAGIPVVVREGLNIAQFVLDNKIGFVVSSVDEADRIVQQMSEQEYNELLSNVKRIQFLVTGGYYTRKVLNEAVTLVMEQ